MAEMARHPQLEPLLEEIQRLHVREEKGWVKMESKDCAFANNHNRPD